MIDPVIDEKKEVPVNEALYFDVDQIWELSLRDGIRETRKGRFLVNSHARPLYFRTDNTELYFMEHIMKAKLVERFPLDPS
jgi:hypothetical protein